MSGEAEVLNTTIITIETCEVEGDADLYALITIDLGSEAIEVIYDLDGLSRIIGEAGRASRAIVWHRADWLYTQDYGKTHLARKEDRRILCGAKRDEWTFAPHHRSHYIHDLCKRCAAIYLKATEA